MTQTPAEIIPALTLQTQTLRAVADDPAAAAAAEIARTVAAAHRAVGDALAIVPNVGAAEILAAAAVLAPARDAAAAAADAVPKVDTTAGDTLAAQIDAMASMASTGITFPGMDDPVDDATADAYRPILHLTVDPLENLVRVAHHAFLTGAAADETGAAVAPPPMTWQDLAPAVVGAWREATGRRRSLAPTGATATARKPRKPRDPAAPAPKVATVWTRDVTGTVTAAGADPRPFARGVGTPVNSAAAAWVKTLAIGGTDAAADLRASLAAWREGGMAGRWIFRCAAGTVEAEAV